ncbi:MAG: exodeoxyribonuclease VII large subunit [Nitrospirae bacterium]|nr:exodeoxyribonuclease VII large subunit [Nitrospirota bacterium]
MFENASKAQILSVSAVTQLIKRHLETRFIDVWVEGEVSNLRMPSSGHLYFTLKDADAQLRGVIFRSSGRSLKFIPKEGQQVLCRGRVTVYEPRGEYQLVIDYLEPRGIGSLQAAFEQLKERLQSEGLFDPARKKPLPMLPRRIGLVTSPTGAAIRDILKVLRRRFANLEVLINPVPVQGEGAAAAIASALDELNEIGGLDVIIVGRGGGSLEDLWAFNEEAVARAIARSNIPVISAVGHEADYTITDFVADLRAPTPSAAAEMVVRTKRELQDRIKFGQVRLGQGIRRRLEAVRSRWKVQQRALRDPLKLIEAHLLRLDELEGRGRRGLFNILRHQAQRLRHARESLRHRSPIERLRRLGTQAQETVKRLDLQMGFHLRQKRNRLESALSKLDSLSPLAILSRGYSITRTLPDMALVKKARRVRPGDRVHVKLHEGSLICHVEKTEG